MSAHQEDKAVEPVVPIAASTAGTVIGGLPPQASGSNSPQKVVTPTEKEFDEGVRKLLEISMTIHDEKYGRMGNAALWMTRISKFNSAYVKADNPPGFMKMFRDFYVLYSGHLAADVFAETEETTVVNDKWLKDETNYEATAGTTGGKGGTGRIPGSKSEGWNPRQATCKGIVLYFMPSVKAVSIPISEIYIIASGLAKEHGEKNIKIWSYPAQILYSIYQILHGCVSDLDNGYASITKNLRAIKALLDEITPAEGTGKDAIGEGISGFSKIMASVMKSAGINVSLDPGQLETAMRTTFEGDAVKKMGTVVSKIMEDVSAVGSEAKPGEAISVVMDKIGDAFKNPEVRDILATSAKETAAKASELLGSIPTADNPAGKSKTIADQDKPATTTDQMLQVPVSLPIPPSITLPIPGASQATPGGQFVLPPINPGDQE